MPNEQDEGLGQSPRDAATGRIKPQGGSLDRAGTEAEQAAGGDHTPPRTDGDEPAGQHNAHAPDALEADKDTERAAAYRENDA